MIQQVFADCKAKCKEMKLVEFEIPQRRANIADRCRDGLFEGKTCAKDTHIYVLSIIYTHELH